MADLDDAGALIYSTSYNTSSDIWAAAITNATVSISGVTGATTIDFTLLTGVPNYYRSIDNASSVTELEAASGVFTAIDSASQTATDINTLLGQSGTGTGYDAYFSDVAKVVFDPHTQASPTSNDVGAMTFAEYDPTALHTAAVAASNPDYHYHSGSSVAGYDFKFPWQSVDDTRLQGNIWINQSASIDDASIGSPGFFILMHEIGHSLGLQHPSFLSASEDNVQYSVMLPGDSPSYDSPNMSYGGGDSPLTYVTSLGLYDIAALQTIYGINYSTRSGDTVYDIGHGLSSSAFLYTIWDGGGTDIIDATGYSHPVEIDLRQGHFSSIGSDGSTSGLVPWDTAASAANPDPGNVAIAYYAVIENAIGTGGADTLIGNSWNNVLYGADGNDILYGDGVTYDTHAGDNYYDTGHPSPASDLSGDDVLIGGNGDDYFYGGKGNDIIHGGYNSSDIASVNSGWDPAGEFTGTNNAAATALTNISYSSDGTDTADYSKLPEGSSATAGITVTYDNSSASNPISVEKGYGDEYGIDALFSIEKIVGTPWNDSFTGTTHSGEAYIYGSAGVDTVDLTSTTTTVDYSLYVDPDHSVPNINVYNSGSDVIVLKSEGNEDTLTNVSTIIGTDNADNYTFNENDGLTLTYQGGAGNDYYEMGEYNTGALTIVEAAVHGVDTLVIDSGDILDFYGFSASAGHETIHVAVESGWNALTSTYDYTSYLTFDASTLGDGYGVEVLNIYSDDLVRATDLYQFLSTTTDDVTAIAGSTLYTDLQLSLSDAYTGGTGGTGAGGGVLPTYDGSGNVTSMQISPAVGGSPISYGIADVIDHPLVLTSFSESYSGGTYTSTASWATYEQAFNFIGGITPGDVRLTASGSQGDAALTINIDSLGFSLTISDFETGNTISGIEIYNSTLHGLIQDASGATLVSTGTNTFGGSYLTLTGLDVDTSASVSVTYFLEALNFAGGGSIDLTAPLTFIGSDSGETLTGLDGRADTIYGMGGDDTIYGYGGNDTLIGGAGNDDLYGGTGDDTYVFAAGWGSDTVHENTGEGTDTLHFTGIAPSDIRMYTDAYGDLHLVQISDPSNSVTVNAGVTGSGDSESAVGSYVESVTFDSGYSTTWDLTGGLNLTGDNSGDYLYGTAYGDTITGGTGADVIYGNGGNDTIIGGAGADYLYGGTGNDTYVFSSGFGNATVHENTGEGTDTIHFTGINPADIRMWTDAYGNLMLQDTSDTSHSITVNAGVTGSGTSESAIGSYVESVTFDSGYSTTWDLTGGLHITGDNSGDYLYGTAYDDTITGGTGADVIYGNGGNDTIIGGAGDDYLYGGTGNDTYVFSSGFGNATVHENLSEGTDAIHFTGINPADIRLWTDAYGNLMLQDTSDTSHSITVNAGVTGSGTSESAIGSYVESVTFDSGYSTTWDLTGGLHITGDNSGDFLYGTAYGDTITGGTGADVIYGNGGNDTIIGGAGDDYLYGGTGNDTYIFSSGFGNATVHENLSEGTDTIHFSGIDPADIRLWTDAYGNLMLQDTSDTSHSITVNAGVTGDNTSESTVGSYVESVTFDSGYSTTWDLTGGLHITGDNSGDYLYGTAYGDTITGGTGDDVIYANAGDDVLYGAGGNDQLTGGPGADTFLFKAATAETGVATIMDFNTSDGDKIDLADVISTYDPATMAIANFVQLATSGSDTQVKVDTDGSGTSYTQIATIQGVTGLNLADLITDGNLIVHHT